MPSSYQGSRKKTKRPQSHPSSGKSESNTASLTLECVQVGSFLAPPFLLSLKRTPIAFGSASGLVGQRRRQTHYAGVTPGIPGTNMPAVTFRGVPAY
jgi:hypothetical protein